MTNQVKDKVTKGETEEKIIVDPFCALVDNMLSIEKTRVRIQVRLSHLTLLNREDPEGKELLERVLLLEKWCDGRISALLKSHPAHSWFSKVKGIGNENIAKVIGMIDIERASTISALWKYAGYAPDPDTNSAMKRVKGQKLPYNSQLRSMCWRLASSLLKVKGKYYEQYLLYKEYYINRFTTNGVLIVSANELPKVEGKRTENEQYISEGHIHNMALRKMIKLFLSHLWLVWREQEGLPTREPYSIQYLNHSTFISPWDMTDR